MCKDQEIAIQPEQMVTNSKHSCFEYKFANIDGT
jgi:hypothetical protein